MDNIQIEKIKGFQVVVGSIKNSVNSVFGKKCKPVYFVQQYYKVLFYNLLQNYY
jgi:hypothetical protein